MARKRPVKDRRLIAVAAVLFLGLLAVSARLFVLQGLEAGHYQQLARQQRDQSIKITPRRGTIFDREGEVLAISEDVTTVYATPYQVKDKPANAKRIAEALGLDAAEVQQKLETKSGFVYIARKVDNASADKVKKMKIEGIGFVAESKRFYPMGSLASQVLGMVDTDNAGQAGLEMYYQDVLGGKPGEMVLERDAAGVPIPGSEKHIVSSADGVDIRLTLDKDIQARLEESLAKAREQYAAKAATAIVMDPNSGDILAMATSPTFDPNDRTKVDPDATRNRAITDTYEPGSALKVITAVAALQEKVVNPDTVVFVPTQLQVADKVFKDAEPKPARQMTFTQIISESSNIGTIKISQQLGKDRLSQYLSRFGLGHHTGVDFPGEVGGIVPPPEKWTGTTAATISIGQGISVTPLQLACVMSAVANGGRKVCPHFLSAELTDSGAKDMGLGGLGDELLTKDTSERTTGILEQVVTPDGTGAQAAVRYYNVAGKTGTAEKPLPNVGYAGTYMATFVGFAPAENPRLVTLVVLDEPTPIWGGETSAPVFSEVMAFSLQHLKISPSWGQEAPGKATAPAPAQQPAANVDAKNRPKD